MRAFWPLVAVAAVAACVALYSRDRVSGCDNLDNGGKLILNRLGVDTMRARFCYAADCRLIAEQMTKVERANWRCE